MKLFDVKFVATLAVISSLFLLSACGDSGSSSGGDALKMLVDAQNSDQVESAVTQEQSATVQTLDLSSNEDEEPVAEPEVAAAEESSAAQAATSNKMARANVDLTFKQTYQPCPDCGLQFDSVELVIVHSQGTFTKRQGHMAIKQAPNRVGHFVADISSIPRDAQIVNAKLNMLLNRAEGIANGDSSSVIGVYGKSGFVREITARNDIKGKGYSKANPMVPIDFTSYARQL